MENAFAVPILIMRELEDGLQLKFETKTEAIVTFNNFEIVAHVFYFSSKETYTEMITALKEYALKKGIELISDTGKIGDSMCSLFLKKETDHMNCLGKKGDSHVCFYTPSYIWSEWRGI